MGTHFGFSPRRLLALALVFAAVPAWAGDPVPDVDVILEQIPGRTVKIDSHSGGFDEIELKVGKDFAKALSPESLPAGWSLESHGKSVRLSGPAVASGQPVRLKLDAGRAPRPDTISYWVRLDGRTLLERKKVTPKLVPPQRVVGSLSGVVTLPTQVAPGEPMQMQVSEAADLPPGGTWTLSGTVVAEEETGDEEPEQPGDEERRLALAVSPEHADEVPDEALADVAAALATHGAQEDRWEVVPLDAGDRALEGDAVEIWAVARIRPSAQREATAIARIVHTETLRTRRHLSSDDGDSSGKDEEIGVVGVRPWSPEGETRPLRVVVGLDLDPRDLTAPGDPRRDPPMEQNDECESSSDSLECCEQAGGAWVEDEELGSFCLEKLPIDTVTCFPKPVPVDPELCTEEFPDASFTIVERPGDGPLRYFDVTGSAEKGGTLNLRTNLSTSRTRLKQTRIASADPEGTVIFQVPEGLEPGDTLALRYIDAFGDLVLDVPQVPDVEVVEASGGDQPRITDAMPRSLAGQRACVCGVFPGPDAWNGILLDGEAVGAPVAASSRMAWIQLPAGLAPGEHVFTGAPEPGFPPSDRVATLVLQVSGALDATKLQRLETTPMRLWVDGTEEPVALRVRNLTPGIITLEGGPDQVIRTSGGTPNQLERTVRGVSPGNFNIQYEMAPDTCPCSASSD